MINNIKFLWEKKPTYLIFWVAQGCNFTCDHCFNYLENKKKTPELTLAEIKEISSHFGHMKYLTLAGGEPMLRKDLADIVKTFYHQNELHICNVISNGWFQDRIYEFCNNVLNECPNLKLSFNISIDGLEETHDHIRQKQGSFKRCVETIESLKNLMGQFPGRFEVAANGVYSAENSGTILDVADFIIDRVKIPYIINLVRGEDIQNNALKNVDVEHFFEVSQTIYHKNAVFLSKKLKFDDLIFGVKQAVHKVIYDSVKHDKMTSKCLAGKKGIVLGAGGEVLLCEVLNIKLGNIRDHNFDIMEVLSNESSQAEIQKIVKNKCHCTWECFQSMNTVFDPLQYPKVAFHTLRGKLS